MRRWRASGVAALGLGAAVAAAAVMAQQAAPAFAAPNLTDSGMRALASGCAMCHGGEGRPVAGSRVASLAGQRADAIAGAMKAFRDGKRESTVMQQIARGYGEDEIAALADYFSRRAP